MALPLKPNVQKLLPRDQPRLPLRLPRHLVEITHTRRGSQKPCLRKCLKCDGEKAITASGGGLSSLSLFKSLP